MTTPNEELIERLRNSRSCDELCDEAADALQSQAERITQWEVDFHEVLLERDTLRDQLTEIEKTEPVAARVWIGSHWIDGNEMQYVYSEDGDGEPLFTRPMPAQDVTELVEALEKLARLGNGEHYGNSDGNMIARMALNRYKGAK